MKLRAALIALPATLLLAACGNSTDTSDAATETTTATTTASAVTTTKVAASTPASTSASALATTALDPRCTPASAETVSLVDSAFSEDVHLEDAWMVDGEGGVTYVAGNIHDTAGERVSSADVWALSDGVLYSLSGDARERSVAVDGRKILGISAGDEYGSLVQNCVTTLVRNRNIESRGN